MDPHDLPARAGDLARHVGVPPPPVIVAELRPPELYAGLARRPNGTWVLRVDPRTADIGHADQPMNIDTVRTEDAS